MNIHKQAKLYPQISDILWNDVEKEHDQLNAEVSELKASLEKVKQSFDLLYENSTEMGAGLRAEVSRLKSVVELEISLRQKAERELADVTKERDALQQYKDSLPADWHKNSSLETWFPYTDMGLKPCACGGTGEMKVFGGKVTECPFCAEKKGEQK